MKQRQWSSKEKLQKVMVHSFRISPYAISPIVDSITIMIKATNQFTDLLFGIGILGLHPAKSSNHVADLAKKQTTNSTFHPFKTLY